MSKHVITRLKDAVHIRLKNNDLRHNIIKSTHVDRKVTINKEKSQLKHNQTDAKKDLMFRIQSTLNKLITKRRQEFEL